MIMICPKCKSFYNISYDYDGERIFFCYNCGYSDKIKIKECEKIECY